jgi:hypothetical protein
MLQQRSKEIKLVVSSYYKIVHNSFCTVPMLTCHDDATSYPGSFHYASRWVRGRLATSRPWGREGAGKGTRDPSDEVASGRLVSLAGI